MARALTVLVLGAIAVLGIFPELLPVEPFAPLPYCSPPGNFQTTFAMTDSSIVFISDYASAVDKEKVGRLEVEIEKLRSRLDIPGLSVAVVKNQELLWARGFGCADIASGRPATPHTPYNLASLTKPFGAMVLLQLVEEGLVDLNDPISEYGVSLESEGVIRVKHLLSHTTRGGVPGTRYRYDGDRFGLIDKVMSESTGRTFRDLVIERILTPLEMGDTMPMPVGEVLTDLNEYQGDPQFQKVWDRLATPYWLVSGYGNVVGEYREYFGSAAGLISSVFDYAKFDIAIDSHMFISEETQELAWTPFRSIRGRELPYGYGWFVQVRDRLRYVWHYGYWDCTSTLIVKVPERRLTFVVFANSDRLSSPFNLGVDQDVRRSPAARAFIDIFVE